MSTSEDRLTTLEQTVAMLQKKLNTETQGFRNTLLRIASELDVKEIKEKLAFEKELQHIRSQREEGGRFFQERWIHLVIKYCSANPPPEKLLQWEDLEPWEQENAIKIYELVQHFAWTVGWPIDSLSQEQKGRFVHSCQIAQIGKCAPQREEMALNDWDQLPAWKQQVYADLFEDITWYQEVADWLPAHVSFFRDV